MCINAIRFPIVIRNVNIRILTIPHSILEVTILLLLTGFEYKNSMVLSFSSFNKIVPPKIAEYIPPSNVKNVYPSVLNQPKADSIPTISILKLESISCGIVFISSSILCFDSSFIKLG